MSLTVEERKRRREKRARAVKEAAEKEKRFYWILGLALFSVVTALWIGGWTAYSWMFYDFGQAGLFGDSFGAINAWFSGLAFGGVVFAIVLQTIELKEQRKELHMTQRELKKSAKAHKENVRLQAANSLYELYRVQHEADRVTLQRQFRRQMEIRAGNIELTQLYKFFLAIADLENLFCAARKTTDSNFVPLDITVEGLKRYYWREMFSDLSNAILEIDRENLERIGGAAGIEYRINRCFFGLHLIPSHRPAIHAFLKKMRETVRKEGFQDSEELHIDLARIVEDMYGVVESIEYPINYHSLPINVWESMD